MTIACTRCGATCDGDIISPPLAFGFKHNAKCGHGVGPLAVMPSARKAEKPKEEIKGESVMTPGTQEIHPYTDSPKVEETAEKPKQKKSKFKH